MKQFPQDGGSGLSDQTLRDYGDAAHFAALAHSGTEGIIAGCELSPSFGVPEVQVEPGMVRIVDNNLDERDHDENGNVITWAEGVQVYKVDQTTVALTDNTVNEVFVVGDQSNPDNAGVAVTSDGTVPSGPSLKIGEVNTNDDTESEQWFLISGSGVLTFPTEAAADSAAAALPEATTVYDRANDSHYYVN